MQTSAGSSPIARIWRSARWLTRPPRHLLIICVQECVSGPRSPPIFEECPWPPKPQPDPTTTSTTTTTTTSQDCDVFHRSTVQETMHICALLFWPDLKEQYSKHHKRWILTTINTRDTDLHWEYLAQDNDDNGDEDVHCPVCPS